ncbi:hypothetical protein K9L05_00290 [Candidatus Babeliales bacterium]|nr:hypothetical protein [Candidatus Babeliales bacterium]MCF7899075.1 hypothetical protein [Candidatus Babeliales bacterium]
MKKNFILFVSFQIILNFNYLLSMPMPAPAGGMPSATPSPAQPETPAPTTPEQQPAPTSSPAPTESPTPPPSGMPTSADAKAPEDKPAAPAQATPTTTQPTQPAPSPAATTQPTPTPAPTPQKPLGWQDTGIKPDEKVATGFVLSDQTKKEREQTKKQLKDMSQNLDQIKNKKEEFYNKFSDIDAKLDKIFLQTNIFVGKQLQKVEEKEKAHQLEIYKKDLNNLKEKAGSIDKSKTELLENLKKIDDNVDKAIDSFFDAKKSNMQILIAPNQSQAEQELKNVKDKLSEIEKIKTDIDSNLNPKVEKAISDIQKIMQEVEQSLKKVEEEGKKLGLPVPVMPEEITKPEPKKKVEKAKQLKEEAGTLYSFSVGAVASATIFVKKVGSWLLKASGNFIQAVREKMGKVENTQTKETTGSKEKKDEAVSKTEKEKTAQPVM